MNTLQKIWVGVALLLGTGVSQATPMTWTDTITFSPNVYLTPGSVFSDQLNIADYGYNPATDTISSYSLNVDLYSPTGQIFAALVVPGTLGNSFFDIDGAAFGGWSLTGDTQLQKTGLLTMTIVSLLGDFYLGSSTLTAYGNGVPTNTVPEPGVLSLMLLGLGVAGVALRFGRKVPQPLTV